MRTDAHALLGQRTQVQPRPANTPALLQRVIASQRIRSVYQPIIRFADRSLAGMEALARQVEAADDGSVSQLFNEATRAGRISDLDWLCRRAGIRGARPIPGHVALHLNISVSDVDDFDVDANRMLVLASACGRGAGDIVLEITDAAATAPSQLVAAVLAFRRNGFLVALDGLDCTSPAAVDDLFAIAPDMAKLDRGLAARLSEPEVRDCIERMVEMAWAERTVLIAQGIETDEQMDMFRRLGLGIGQGFLLGRPAAIEHLGLALSQT